MPCIYGLKFILALCQISACENGSLLWRDEQMRCSRERCTGNVALTFTLTVGCNENIYKNTMNVTRSLYIYIYIYRKNNVLNVGEPEQ